MSRRSYEQSFAELSEATTVVGEPRPNPTRPPRRDDAEPGPSLLHQQLADVDFLDITLPGLFMSRCELRGVSFSGSDLSLATLHWSDFSRCDFAGCDLSGADLRGCTFEDCSFRGTDLRGADLRHASFSRCEAGGATFTGALVSRDQANLLGLDPEQCEGPAWQDAASAGDLPPD